MIKFIRVPLCTGCCCATFSTLEDDVIGIHISLVCQNRQSLGCCSLAFHSSEHLPWFGRCCSRMSSRRGAALNAGPGSDCFTGFPSLGFQLLYSCCPLCLELFSLQPHALCANMKMRYYLLVPTALHVPAGTATVSSTGHGIRLLA